jgi:predicted RecB family nuclease
MSSKITQDILESYVFCKSKGYLQSRGEYGKPSDYAMFLTQLREEVRRKAMAKMLAQLHKDQVVQGRLLTTEVLRDGPLFVLEARVEDGPFCLALDGLKQVPGESTLGAFHYIPMLCYEGHQIRREQRFMLTLYGLFLSRLQGRMPDSGILWHGQACQATKVRLPPDLRRAEQCLRDIQEMAQAVAPPSLILNQHCQVCEFRQRCHDQAVREDNLSLLRGMSEKEMKHRGRKGIFTITQLAHTFRPRRKGKRTTPPTPRHDPALHALAIRDQRIYVLGTPQLPTCPVQIYLDIESNPEAGFVYLIGMITVVNGTETQSSFWADHKEQEVDIFEQFVAEVTRHGDFLVFCYGSYERAFITRMQKVAKRKKLVDKILNALVNVLTLVYSQVYFPTYSNGLKDIGRYVGCTWTAPEASGLQSIAWRIQWEVTQREEWKQKLTTYNLEDCVGLQRVTEVLATIVDRGNAATPPPLDKPNGPPIAFLKDVEKLSDFHTWGRVPFVHPDYEYINKCAYFDYQRDRVYIRTSKILRKRRVGKKKSPNRTLRASQHVMIVASRCPVCKSKEIIHGVKKQVRTQEPRVKRAFDLVLAPSGVKRKVIACRTSVHQCLQCSTEFVPDQHQRLDKHFHGLKSWAMFQHVAYRISMETLPKMAEEFFGIHIVRAEMLMFKAFMAEYYKTTYHKLLRKILSGHLLHVDETEVKLQQGKGYVWVFTNLEEVVYMFRPNREGDFLRELLKDFHGVVVSDFYAAYDALACPQQKCLIHLMRDLNQELLDNPYDDELKAITSSFGSMLRAIIETIDQHGLQQKYLAKHDQETTRFFRSLTAESFHSEAAEALRARLLKYQEKLFTFIHYDGVPWNNNNAEHAIKQFAYYREHTSGMLRETGLHDYLVLLSICQTCRYKGVSFLHFLLSKSRDVDMFCERKHRKRPSSTLELYPKGFTHYHLDSVQHKKRLVHRIDES